MRNRTLPSLISLAVAMATSLPALSQQNVLEEIVITATKREETLRDVPISVSVTSAETIEQAHIRDLIDLQTVVPSLRVTQLNAVGQTNFIIRGFGNGAGNDGIENSVGVFIDGVFRSRTSSALDDLPEVERIEVLRGPQSTLFGKNVSAGAISIVTARPEHEWGGLLEATAGNFDLLQGRAILNAPLGDTLAVRLSGNISQRDGWMKNLTTGNDVNDRDRWSVRGDLLWEPNDAVALRVIADFNEITETCCGVVPVVNGPATQLIGAPPPIGLGGAIGDPADKFSRNLIFNTDPTNVLRGKGLSAQLDWDVGAATLTSITAYREQTNRSIQDVDFTGADLSNKDEPNSIDTFTQELRLASNTDGRLNWLLGAFFQDESLDSGRDTTYGTQIRGYTDRLSGPVPPALLAALPPPLAAALAGRSNIYALELLQSLVTPSIVPGGTYFQAGQGISDFYTMDQTSYSVFGQLDFEVTDRLTLTGGLAYLYDKKEAVSHVVMNDPFSALDLQNVPQFAVLGLPPNLYGPLGALQFFYGNTPNHGPVNFPNAQEDGKLEDDQVTYALRAAYDFGVVNTYVSYTTGWKAGAYNLSSDSRPPDVNGVGRTAGPEDVTVIELGAKAEFDSGYVNVAIFDQSIDGFQSNAYTGTGYSLVNAGEQSVRGVELDAAYVPASWLALTASVTYLDAEYESFTRAPCVSYDVVRCPLNPQTGRIPDFRDLSGQRPAGIPEWALSLSATFTKTFDNGSSAFLRAEYAYNDEVQLVETVPPEYSTWGTNNLNASIGYTSEPHGYDVLLWARNLTDDDTLIAVFPTVAQTGSYSGFPNQPRTWGLTLRKRF